MTKVAFFYANGTAYLVNHVNLGFSIASNKEMTFRDTVIREGKDAGTATISGLDGRLVTGDFGPQNDPFASLLNPDVWDATKIAYPATSLAMGDSIDHGVNQVVKLIQALKPGTPFAIGGYSQGAAVMSSIYNEIRTGSLTSRASGFLGGVTFGNPRRQLNHRGEVGGTWSGAWDNPGVNTGGHGSFPTTGNYARLTGCDGTQWIDFVNVNDPFTATGDTTAGLNWTSGNQVFIGSAPLIYSGRLATKVLSGVLLNNLGIGNPGPVYDGIKGAFNSFGDNFLVDAVDHVFQRGGGGHVLYPFMGPPNSDGTYNYTTVSPGDGNTYLKPTGQTSYQIALEWLESKALSWATAPVVLGSTATGWSTTLKPPAS